VVTVRNILWWIYGVQAVFLSAILLGGLARHEMSFWPAWNSSVDVYVHLIFYSVFLVVPYALLATAYGKYAPGLEGHFFIIAVWVFATICPFHQPIFEFVYGVFGGFDIGAPGLYQWLHILWVALTVVMIILWRAVSNEVETTRAAAGIDDRPPRRRQSKVTPRNAF
jgi:hypothetical protein